MKFMKSGFVGGEVCPTLSDYDKLKGTIKIPETEGYVLHE